MKDTRKGAKQGTKQPPAQTVRTPVTESNVEGRIAKRAHEINLERGREPGHALEHWIEAEHEILRPI